MFENWTPLDPNEGPTVWATEKYGNQYEITVAEGSNPNDPLRTVTLSKNEISNLQQFADDV